jgi:hypothetical protein
MKTSAIYQRAWQFFLANWRPSTEGPPPPYGYAWHYYPAVLRRVSSMMGARVDDVFRSKGVMTGTLPTDVLSELRQAIDQAPHRLIELDDHDEGYVFNPGLGPYEAVLNRDHVYLQLGSEQSPALRWVIRSLRRPVKGALGTPWHVVNTRCWKTPAGASESGPNAWHADGFPLASPKLMIYVTGAGPTLGTTEIKALDGEIITVEGPPGTWVLFRNGDLQHRGIGPKTGERIIVELTLAPALRFDPWPVYAGLNAKYPQRPWYRSKNRTGQLFSRANGESKCG